MVDYDVSFYWGDMDIDFLNDSTSGHEYHGFREGIFDAKCLELTHSYETAKENGDNNVVIAYYYIVSGVACGADYVDDIAKILSENHIL